MTLFLFPKGKIIGCGEDVDHVAFFDDGVPDFMETTLESLYQCLMTTLVRFRQHYPIESAKTYVVYKDGKVVTALLFSLEKEKIVVYNEQIHISQKELVRFAHHAFKRYPEVRQLSLYAIEMDDDMLPFSHQRVECLEDIRMDLPRNPADYLASLGKKTAETIRRAEKKLRRDHPSFKMQFYSKDEVAVEDILKIVTLNRRRIEAKSQGCYHTEESIQKLVELVKRYGLVGVALVDNEVRGGVIQLRVGSHWYSHTVAHDPEFDAYRLGQLCNYFGVIETITQGGGVFHFGWGRSDHKYRLGASNRDLFKLDIYKSPVALAIDCLNVIGRSLAWRRRQLKLWVAERKKAGDTPVAKTINYLTEARSLCIDALRRLKSKQAAE